MKKYMIMFLLCAGTAAYAQKQKPDTFQAKGCWVLESNVKSPRKQIAKFYGENQQLLYQETFEGKVLNIARKRVQKKLNGALVKVLQSKDYPDVKLANLIRNK